MVGRPLPLRAPAVLTAHAVFKDLDRMTQVANVALFQAGWFACVLGASHGLPWIGAIAAALIVGWHTLRAAHPARELALVGIAVALGTLFDTVLLQSRVVHFAVGALVDGVAPYWMVALWALFATTLNVSLRRLRTHPVLGALLGGIGGPLAYYAGARLGALEFAAAGAALASIAIGWAVLAPVLFAAARRLDGYAG
jgi:hypothetical protein